jgi:hypothetical protein
MFKTYRANDILGFAHHTSTFFKQQFPLNKSISRMFFHRVLFEFNSTAEY